MDWVSDFQICFLILSVRIEVPKQHCLKHKLLPLVKLSWKAVLRKILRAMSWLSGKEFYDLLVMPAMGV